MVAKVTVSSKRIKGKQGGNKIVAVDQKNGIMIWNRVSQVSEKPMRMDVDVYA